MFFDYGENLGIILSLYAPSSPFLVILPSCARLPLWCCYRPSEVLSTGHVHSSVMRIATDIRIYIRYTRAILGTQFNDLEANDYVRHP